MAAAEKEEEEAARVLRVPKTRLTPVKDDIRALRRLHVRRSPRRLALSPEKRQKRGDPSAAASGGAAGSLSRALEKQRAAASPGGAKRQTHALTGRARFLSPRKRDAGARRAATPGSASSAASLASARAAGPAPAPAAGASPRAPEDQARDSTESPSAFRQLAFGAKK